MKRLTPLMFGLMLAFGVSGTAMAQGAPAQEDYGPAQQGMEAPAAANFADEDIEKFADVQPEIESIRAEYSQRLQDVDDPEQAAELQNEAGQLMVDTVVDAGLEVETYNNIAIALQSDPELRDRVQSMLN